MFDKNFSFSSGDYESDHTYNYQFCSKCGKLINSSQPIEKNSAGEYNICTCTQKEKEIQREKELYPWLGIMDGKATPLKDWGVKRIDMNEKIYLGKIYGIPVYVNDELDRRELAEKFKMNLGWEFINYNMEEYFDYDTAKKEVEEDNNQDYDNEGKE
jgi:hypothetical protein